MNYAEALEYLNSFTNFERMPGLANDLEGDGLERVRLLLRLLDRPHLNFPAVVIAGTKGKGSVSAILESVLSKNGHLTGLYTSPHLHTFRERIRVGGELIPAADLARLVAAIKPIVERIEALGDPSLRPTMYELATAVAFCYFSEREVDIALLEVGLGGRLDAVNVVNPLVSIITSISLDHTQVLGDTIEKIAFEKSGIIKEGGRVVTAPQVPEALGVISYTASRRGAQLVVVGRDTYISSRRLPRIVADEHGIPQYQVFTVAFGNEVSGEQAKTSVELPLLGSHQQVNAAVALAALPILVSEGYNLSLELVLQGLKEVRWPGRFEVAKRDPLVIVDGAHNVESIARLHQALVQLYYRQAVVVVLGVSADKDIEGIVAEIGGWPESITGPEVECLIFTQSRHPRAADPESVMPFGTKYGLRVEISPSVADAVKRAEGVAQELAESGQPALVLVTGSLFAVAEAREYCGLAPDLSEERV